MKLWVVALLSVLSVWNLHAQTRRIAHASHSREAFRFDRYIDNDGLSPEMMQRHVQRYNDDLIIKEKLRRKKLSGDTAMTEAQRMAMKNEKSKVTVDTNGAAPVTPLQGSQGGNSNTDTADKSKDTLRKLNKAQWGLMPELKISGEGRWWRLVLLGLGLAASVLMYGASRSFRREKSV